MRRRTRNIGISKYIIIPVFAAAMVFMGGTYAAWNDDVEIKGSLRSGSMNMVFGRTSKREAVLTGRDGAVLEELLVELDYVADGKKVKVTFAEGLPIRRLAEEDVFLRLRFPVEASAESSYETILEKEADFSVKGRPLLIKAQDAFFQYAGAVYPMEGAAQAMDLGFRSYAFAEREGDSLYVGSYLQLNETSREEIAALPETFEIKAEDLEALVADDTLTYVEDGFLVTYLYELDITLDQAG